MEGNPPPRRRWWRRPSARLSLRVLMVFVVLLGLGLGWVAHRARVQRDAVLAIEKTGGKVIYEWQRTSGAGLKLQSEPKWPRWLVKLLGVDYFGYVVRVQLGKQTTDAEMARIGRLDRLEAIIGIAPEVTDAGAAHLRGLVHLDHLRLFGSKVTGAYLANIRGMTKLEDLHLTGLPVTDADLANLEGLTSLTFLSLGSTKVTDAGLAYLAKLVNLEVLYLDSNEITGPGLAHLKNMPKLHTLILSRCQIRDISSIPPLPSLRALAFNETPIGDAELATMPNFAALESLSLPRTNVTDAGLREILRLKDHLKRLTLSGTTITDAAAPTLSEMANLTVLLVDETKITDAALDQFLALKGLTTLDIRKDAVTAAGIARLRKALPGLKLVSELIAANNSRARRIAAPAPPSGSQP